MGLTHVQHDELDVGTALGQPSHAGDALGVHRARDAAPHELAKALIDSTLELLGRAGYRGATTRDTAANAGLSEITLFRHFGTKAGLVTAALEHATQSFRDAIGSPTDDVAADLTTLAAGYAAFVDRWPALIDRVLPEVAAESKVGASARALMADNAAATHDLVDHHRRAGRLAGEPTADIVRAFLGPLLARASLRVVLPPGPFDAARYTDRFLRGYGAGSGPPALRHENLGPPR